jgi:prepilin-type N-terminal cleavage/methylation domain-containing protein
MTQRGYTIVELLVAVMIFSVGLLGMAGTASVIMSTITSTKSRTIAASVAESRFERIRATPCVSRAGGSAMTRGISEAWTLDRLARADDVTVNVSFLSNRRKRTESFRSFLPC